MKNHVQRSQKHETYLRRLYSKEKKKGVGKKAKKLNNKKTDIDAKGRKEFSTTLRNKELYFHTIAADRNSDLACRRHLPLFTYQFWSLKFPQNFIILLFKKSLLTNHIH